MPVAELTYLREWHSWGFWYITHTCKSMTCAIAQLVDIFLYLALPCVVDLSPCLLRVAQWVRAFCQDCRVSWVRIHMAALEKLSTAVFFLAA